MKLARSAALEAHVASDVAVVGALTTRVVDERVTATTSAVIAITSAAQPRTIDPETRSLSRAAIRT
jgi:hypothetical protein